MSLPKETIRALESIVGPQYVSEDPVVCQVYARGGYGKDIVLGRGNLKPACVVLPGSTEEVQSIVKLANRYKTPFVPVGTFWFNSCGPYRENVISIDLKRMNKIEIDDRNMYAVCEPYVIFSQLQHEAMKRGLYMMVPGGGAQVSVVNNVTGAGYSPLNYRIGGPQRRILGVEWVMPDGEILKLGSASMLKEYFWGEGPGPDLRGILRGPQGWQGGLGIFTKAAVKLYPFQPERLVPTGISPDTTLELPTKRMRRYNITYPDQPSLVKAMREVSKAEIGAAITKVPVMWRYRARSTSKEHFWELWKGAKEDLQKNTETILLVVIIGYTSEKQVEYEERVLTDIVTETGGTLRRTKQTDESWIKNADSAGMWWSAGGYISVKINVDSLDHALKSGRDAAALKKKYLEGAVDDYGDPGWFQISSFGHEGYNEFLVEFDATSDPKVSHRIDNFYVDAVKQDVKEGCYSGMQMSYGPVGITGPAYGDHHILLKEIKEMFDPGYLSNPPRPFEFDEKIERECPWVKKDW
ncbi:MAG: GlcD [Dehalococcoidia bacterium]|nr:GlcD [Dehalococcoidia bacterium]